MAYPGSYAPPSASSYGTPSNYYAGTGYASSSYDKPYAGQPSYYPMQQQQQQQQQYPPQQLCVNDSMLVRVLALNHAFRRPCDEYCEFTSIFFPASLPHSPPSL